MALETPLNNRRMVCENVRFEVFLDDVPSANGELVRNYLVVAPKVQVGDMIAGVAILPVFEGKLGLLRVYRHAVQRHLWEIPRGFVEPGESERTAALRELEEETGLLCADSDLQSLGTIAPEPGILAARAHLFVAHHCRPGRPFRPEELGHKEFRRFDPAQIANLQETGEIQDSTTLIAYLLHRDRLAGY